MSGSSPTAPLLLGVEPAGTGSRSRKNSRQSGSRRSTSSRGSGSGSGSGTRRSRPSSRNPTPGKPRANFERNHVFSPDDPLVKQLRDIWDRPVERVAVVSDVPRMARHMQIHTATGQADTVFTEEWKDFDESGRFNWEPVSTMRNVLCILAEALDGLEQAELIARKFPMYEWKHDAIAEQLKPFLRAVVGEDSCTTRVLKASNQNIIAPGVLILKKCLPPFTQHTTTDTRDGWVIKIYLGDIVTVVHDKKEHGTKEDFQLTWRLTMEFDKAMTCMSDARFTIATLSYGPTVSEAARSEITASLAPYMIETAVVLRKE